MNDCARLCTRMQDFLFVSFFLGHHAGDAAKDLLRQCDLLEVAVSAPANRNAWLGDSHFGVSIRLPSEDEGLKTLLTKLRTRGIAPFTRVDREYTTEELDRADLLLLRIATTGLLGGVDYSQTYDITKACVTCGAGSIPLPPLVADLGSMGKKDIDHLIYEGHLVVSKRLAEAMKDMTGVSVEPVRSPRRSRSQFFWLRITSELPKMHPSTRGYLRESLCADCGRAGHHSAHSEPEKVVFQTLRNARDFNLTWEYFGDWRQVRNKAQHRRIGGVQQIVVSQSVRQEFLRTKVRRLVWVPVTISNLAAAATTNQTP